MFSLSAYSNIFLLSYELKIFLKVNQRNENRVNCLVLKSKTTDNSSSVVSAP